MKNLVFAFASFFTFIFASSINAQTSNIEKLTLEEKESSSEEFAVLENFKANKSQRKVIRKMKKYVTPKIIEKGKRTTALQDKMVTVQLSLGKDGEIIAI